MSTTPPVWSSDVPISVPQAPAEEIIIPMFGFGMTQLGLFHDLTDVEYEQMRQPSYSPDRPSDEVIYDDGGL